MKVKFESSRYIKKFKTKKMSNEKYVIFSIFSKNEMILSFWLFFYSKSVLLKKYKKDWEHFASFCFTLSTGLLFLSYI